MTQRELQRLHKNARPTRDKEELMFTKTKVLIGSAGIAVVGLALATPVINLTSPVLSKGTQERALNAHGDYEVADGYFKVAFSTNRPATIVNTEGAYNPGGENGWHSHPGMVINTLISGTVHWYDDHCNLTTYNAGD